MDSDHCSGWCHQPRGNVQILASNSTFDASATAECANPEQSVNSTSLCLLTRTRVLGPYGKDRLNFVDSLKEAEKCVPDLIINKPAPKGT